MNNGRDNDVIGDSTRLQQHMREHSRTMKPISSLESYTAVFGPIEKAPPSPPPPSPPPPTKGKLIIMPIMDRISRLPFGTHKKLD